MGYYNRCTFLEVRFKANIVLCENIVKGHHKKGRCFKVVFFFSLVDLNIYFALYGFCKRIQFILKDFTSYKNVPSLIYKERQIMVIH